MADKKVASVLSPFVFVQNGQKFGNWSLSSRQTVSMRLFREKPSCSPHSKWPTTSRFSRVSCCICSKWMQIRKMLPCIKANDSLSFIFRKANVFKHGRLLVVSPYLSMYLLKVASNWETPSFHGGEYFLVIYSYKITHFQTWPTTSPFTGSPPVFIESGCKFGHFFLS
jgi:hypothetical protein